MTSDPWPNLFTLAQTLSESRQEKPSREKVEKGERGSGKASPGWKTGNFEGI